MAVGSLGKTVNATALMARPIPATRPRTFPPLLRMTITAFLHRVKPTQYYELNGVLYTTVVRASKTNSSPSDPVEQRLSRMLSLVT
jgi:hypothetical protein